MSAPENAIDAARALWRRDLFFFAAAFFSSLCAGGASAATVGMENLAADAPPAHKELKKAAAKKKRSRLQRALAASIAFSAAEKGASDSSGPLASHPD